MCSHTIEGFFLGFPSEGLGWLTLRVVCPVVSYGLVLPLSLGILGLKDEGSRGV